MRLLPAKSRHLLRAILVIGVLLSLTHVAAQDDSGEGRTTAGTTDGPAEIHLQRAGGVTSSSVELGQQLHLEVVITPGNDPVTGYTFYLAYDADVFSLVAGSGEGRHRRRCSKGGVRGAHRGISLAGVGCRDVYDSPYVSSRLFRWF